MTPKEFQDLSREDFLAGNFDLKSLFSLLLDR
jgi:hypothetical protein